MKKSKWIVYNEIIGWLNLIVLAAVVAASIVALMGCATAQPRNTRPPECAVTEIVTHTPEKWSDSDQRAYSAALRRCSVLYPLSPCLKQFIRMEQYRYRCVCGGRPDGPEFDLWVSP